MKRRVSVSILTLLLSVMSTLAFNVQYVKAEPTTWTVDDDGPADFSSIQDAINEASPGDTIHVCNGTYYENVVVNKTVALFGEKRDFTIIDGGGAGHVILVTANDVTLSGFTIQRGRSESPFCGVQLDNVHGSSINNNLVTDNYHGISTFWSIRNTISDNTLIENAYGIGLYYSYPHTENGENMVANNEITSHWLDGIYVWNSMGNSIINNTVSNSGYGIRISGSDGNVLRDNKMIDNSYNFGVDGWQLSEFIQDIDSSNIVNEKPVYYLINQGKLTIDPATFPDIGYLGLVNSTDVTVKDLNISSNLQGILFAFTNSSNIENVRVTHNVEGIILSGSSNNTISHNMATSNWVGIRLDNSDYNILSHNAISSNNLASGIYLFESDANTIANNILESNMGWGGGITLGWSSSNIIKGNDILENTCAFDISYSDDNTVSHNNILNNTIQVNSESSINLWDDGYPSGGNYWSDYEERYPDAEEFDNSGIWDTPYIIDENNQDNYPLMGPHSPFPRTMGELKTEIEELGSEGEIDNQGIVKSLIAKLNGARRLVNKGKMDEAKSILEDDFIPQVQNLSGIHITVEAADILIQSAEYILSHL